MLRLALLSLALLAACGSPPAASRVDAAPPPPPPPDAAPPLPAHQTYPDVAAAVGAIVAAERPRVVGFGEVHNISSGPNVKSALARFTGPVFESLAPRASDIVVETWLSSGKCGKTEDKVTTNVAKDTLRPPETTTEVQLLARRAKELGVNPIGLEMACGEYEKLLGPDGKVDYERVLQLIGRELGRATVAALTLRDKARAKDKTPAEAKLVLVYGGSLHNDVVPDEAIRPYNYPQALPPGTPFVEIDLYVPELAERVEFLKTEPFYPLLAAAATDEVLVYKIREHSYAIVLERSR